MNLRDAWEEQAEAWAAWARTPGHDTFFWLHGLPNLRALLPPSRGRTLDLGCGEGRLSRELDVRGYDMIAVDGSPTLTRLARAHEQPVVVMNADAAFLPCADASFDLIVASMSLQDVDDLDGAVRESARVLTPGGRLVASVVHPVNGAGAFEGDDANSRFVLTDSYVDDRRYVDEFTRDGLSMTFHSFHHSFETYSRALEAAGLLIEGVREPGAGEALVAAVPTAAKWRQVPVFLFVRAVKPA